MFLFSTPPSRSRPVLFGLPALPPARGESAPKAALNLVGRMSSCGTYSTHIAALGVTITIAITITRESDMTHECVYLCVCVWVCLLRVCVSLSLSMSLSLSPSLVRVT